MLKLHVVRVGRHGYYMQGLQRGDGGDLEVAVESRGVWTGPAAPLLGLHGQVDAETFGRVMDGFDPETGRLLRLSRGSASVAGFDLTFCAPKSVSVVEALGPKEIAREAGAGHDAAVAEACAYLSHHAVGIRRGDGVSRQLLPSTGMVAGDFRHLTSRALDPHLHTHVVAANLAQGRDGVWSAADSRRIFAHLRPAGLIYQSRLRLELSQRLGVAWEVRPSGLGDVSGVDVGLRRLFSQRSAAIDEYVSRHHHGARGQHQGAFFATRPDKDLTQSLESLVLSWKRRAVDFGFDLSDLSQVVGRSAQAGREASASFDPRRMVDRLTEAGRPDGSMARRDLVALVASVSLGGTTVTDIDLTVDRIVTSVATRVEKTRGSEPRWRRGDVLAVARDQGSELAVHSEQDLALKDPVDRRDGREKEPTRDLSRHELRRRERGRGHGLGL